MTPDPSSPADSRCPKCGKPLFLEIRPLLVPNGVPDLEFECNSIQYSGGFVKQSDKCRMTELEQTVARLTRYELQHQVLLKECIKHHAELLLRIHQWDDMSDTEKVRWVVKTIAENVTTLTLEIACLKEMLLGSMSYEAIERCLRQGWEHRGYWSESSIAVELARRAEQAETKGGG